jgi:hypothetical protein
VWKSPNLMDSCGHEEDVECIRLPCQHIPKKSAEHQNLQLGIPKMVVHSERLRLHVQKIQIFV